MMDPVLTFMSACLVDAKLRGCGTVNLRDPSCLNPALLEVSRRMARCMIIL